MPRLPNGRRRRDAYPQRAARVGLAASGRRRLYAKTAPRWALSSLRVARRSVVPPPHCEAARCGRRLAFRLVVAVSVAVSVSVAISVAIAVSASSADRTDDADAENRRVQAPQHLGRP